MKKPLPVLVTISLSLFGALLIAQPPAAAPATKRVVHARELSPAEISGIKQRFREQNPGLEVTSVFVDSQSGFIRGFENERPGEVSPDEAPSDEEVRRIVLRL